jgi:hypothetical protein
MQRIFEIFLQIIPSPIGFFLLGGNFLKISLIGKSKLALTACSEEKVCRNL